MENQIVQDEEVSSEQELDLREYERSNIFNLPAPKEDATKSTSNVSANITANVTPEHIKEVGDGFRKNRESINMLEAYSHLPLDNLTSDNCENLMRHMDNVVNQSFQLKQLQVEKAKIWKIILASGVSLSLCLLGGGYLLKCLKK